MSDTQKNFVVEELARKSNGEFVESGSRFVWDAKTQSSPRQGWEYGIKLRTAREDYPGSDEPVEHVLGPNFESFELAGMWDDRYAGPGFAENQRIEFENMVRRGNFCRVSFETITFTGLITSFKATYVQSYRIGYHFTFSPHYRVEGKTKVQAPRVVDPFETLNKATEAILFAGVIRDAAIAAVLNARITDAFGVATAKIFEWQARVDTINAILLTRTLDPRVEAQNSISKVVQAFQDMKSSAISYLATAKAYRSDSNLDFEDATSALAFDSFVRGIATQARALIILAEEARAQLAKLVDPNALAIYRPLAGESLYGISNKFFGTPFRWREIATRNRLNGMTLAGTEMLVIPNSNGNANGGGSVNVPR